MPAKSDNRSRLRNAGINLLGAAATLIGIVVLTARSAYPTGADEHGGMRAALMADATADPALFWLVVVGPLVAALAAASVAVVALRSVGLTSPIRRALALPLIVVCCVLATNLVFAARLGLVVLAVPFLLYPSHVAWAASTRG
jgi:hypothetical protein